MNFITLHKSSESVFFNIFKCHKTYCVNANYLQVHFKSLNADL